VGDGRVARDGRGVVLERGVENWRGEETSEEVGQYFARIPVALSIEASGGTVWKKHNILRPLSMRVTKLLPVKLILRSFYTYCVAQHSNASCFGMLLVPQVKRLGQANLRPTVAVCSDSVCT
jgi:hypothetical protein